MKKYVIAFVLCSVVVYLLYSFFTPYSKLVLKNLAEERLKEYSKEMFIDKQKLLPIKSDSIDKDNNAVFIWKYKASKGNIRYISIVHSIYPTIFDEGFVTESDSL